MEGSTFPEVVDDVDEPEDAAADEPEDTFVIKGAFETLIDLNLTSEP